MTSVAMLSPRPCPNGCSLSGARPEILKPTRTTTDVRTSESVWKESAIREMLPMSCPDDELHHEEEDVADDADPGLEESRDSAGNPVSSFAPAGK